MKEKAYIKYVIQSVAYPDLFVDKYGHFRYIADAKQFLSYAAAYNWAEKYLDRKALLWKVTER